jgi:hypothetical protein
MWNALCNPSADVHRQLCEVYGEHAMSDSVVRRWVRHFNEWRKKVHDDTRSGRSSVVHEDLVRAMEEKNQDNRRFTISSLSLCFPQISRSLVHKIVSHKLRFRKLCSRWVPKLLRGRTQTETAGQCFWPFWHDVVMLHDNACRHTAAKTQDLIATFGWEQFDHPLYSPDLAPRDFHVFLHLKTRWWPVVPRRQGQRSH